MKGGTGGSFPGRGQGRQLQGSSVPGVPKRDLYRHQDSLIRFARRLAAQKSLVGITEPFQSKNQIVVALHDTTKPLLKLSLNGSLRRGKLQYLTRIFCCWHDRLF
jgi:hypothetical protein